MSDYNISSLSPVLAFDSRANPTVSCTVQLAGGGRGTATVPSGKSTGRHEAVELRDGGEELGGRGVDKAIKAIATDLSQLAVGAHLESLVELEKLDTAMRSLDGSVGLQRLGANAVLAVSIAAALASAAQARVEPYRWFGNGATPLLPMPMINIFSGGAHAMGALDVQDLLVIPVGAQTVEQALRWTWEVRHAVGDLLRGRGLNPQLVADEGGFGVSLASTEEGLGLLVDGIEAAGLQPGTQVAIAIDIAATQLLRGEVYHLATEGRNLSSREFVDEIATWCSDFPIVSIEDPLAEDDWEGWHYATERLAHQQLLGDDLFVTSTERLTRGITEETASAVLVKPNQCGTLSSAHEAVTTARRAGYATVLSARSGETEDSWLSDLAVGWRTGQIKVGSLTRSERTAKWNRLLRISQELGTDAQFADRSCIVSRSSLQPQARVSIA